MPKYQLKPRSSPLLLFHRSWEVANKHPSFWISIIVIAKKDAVNVNQGRLGSSSNSFAPDTAGTRRASWPRCRQAIAKGIAGFCSDLASTPLIRAACVAGSQRSIGRADGIREGEPGRG